MLEENPSNSNAASFSINIIIDSVKAAEIIKQNNWNPSKSFADQCYAIRVKNDENTKSIYVLAGEGTGGMYGAFDVAEAIQCKTINTLAESDNTPYLTKKRH